MSLTVGLDVDFERRWDAWMARGLAHERLVRRRFILSAIVVSASAIGAFIGYALFSA